jgi:hypothetical protein
MKETMQYIKKTLFMRSLIRTSSYWSIGATIIVASIINFFFKSQILLIILASIEVTVLVLIVINSIILTNRINDLKKKYPKEYTKVLQKQREWDLEHAGDGGSSSYGL